MANLADELNDGGFRPKVDHKAESDGLVIFGDIVIPRELWALRGVDFKWTVTVSRGGSALTARVTAENHDGNKAYWSSTHNRWTD